MLGNATNVVDVVPNYSQKTSNILQCYANRMNYMISVLRQRRRFLDFGEIRFPLVPMATMFIRWPFMSILRAKESSNRKRVNEITRKKRENLYNDHKLALQFRSIDAHFLYRILHVFGRTLVCSGQTEHPIQTIHMKYVLKSFFKSSPLHLLNVCCWSVLQHFVCDACSYLFH